MRLLRRPHSGSELGQNAGIAGAASARPASPIPPPNEDRHLLSANTIKGRRHHIEGLIIPKLGGLPAAEVTTTDVVALLKSVGEKSVNVAELVFTAMSEVFKHGIASHAVTANPCIGVSVTAVCGQAPPTRTRLKLSEGELRELLAALPSIGPENALTVKILLVTCTRIGELARAEWSQVDFDQREWHIPGINSKTGKGFTVPMTPAVTSWFEQLRVLACGSRFVLPARQTRRNRNHGGETHFEPRALNAMLHKLCDKCEGKIRRFTPHDLRSTARSHLGALKVPILVAERCLNHAIGG